MRKQFFVPMLSFLFCTAMLNAAVLVRGTVVDPFGKAVPKASLSLSSGETTTADDNGDFLLLSLTATGIEMQKQNLSLNGGLNEVRIQAPRGEKVSVHLLDLNGRRRELLSPFISNGSETVLPLATKGGLATGVYLLQIQAGKHMKVATCAAQNGQLHVPASLDWTEKHGVLGKNSAVLTFSATASGFGMGEFPVIRDTSYGVVATLYPTGLSRPAAVTVTEGTETLSMRLRAANGTSSYSWMGNNKVAAFNNMKNGNIIQKSFKVIYLDNGLINVTVAPELGMRVLRVLDKTTKPERQVFAVMDNPGNANPAWQDVGGVEPSFPFYEAGTPTLDDEGNLINKAGYYISKNADGSVDVIMSLRFDQHQQLADMLFLGRYGDRPLSSVVSLKPGDIAFSVRYVADNQNPLRRNSRLWNDALFPDEGSHEWLFPSKYGISHGASNITDYQSSGYPKNFPANSLFALYPQYPFAGLYYPGANANHLRVTDQTKVPGLKIYPDGPLEIWGSTDVVFEAPGHFVPAFEPLKMEYRYFMARNIGKVAYANEFLAIGVEGSNYKLISTRPLLISVFEYGSNNNALQSEQVCGPTQVLSGAFSQGLRVVSLGKELCNIKLPLVYEDNRARFDSVLASAELSGATAYEYRGPNGNQLSPSRFNLDSRWKFNYELENSQNKWWMLNSLAVLGNVESVKESDDPDVILSMANTAYRHGGFAAVETFLSRLGSRLPEGAKYLQALMKMEKGESADFSGTVIEGKYFSALQKIGTSQTAAAISDLDQLIAERPMAIRPHLLRAYLKKDVNEALWVRDQVPGSLEAWAVLKELGYSEGGRALDGLLKQDGGAAERLEDFWKEAKQGKWRHGRRYEYQNSWFTNLAMPAFPDFLKYNPKVISKAAVR